MTVLTEGRHAGEFIMSEANFHRSRDNIVISSGQGVLGPGTVLAKSGAEYVVYAGSGAAAILIGRIDTTDADTPGAAITRDAEVNGHCLDFGGDCPVNETGALADLAALGIIARF